MLCAAQEVCILWTASVIPSSQPAGGPGAAVRRHLTPYAFRCGIVQTVRILCCDASYLSCSTFPSKFPSRAVVVDIQVRCDARGVRLQSASRVVIPRAS